MFVQIGLLLLAAVCVVPAKGADPITEVIETCKAKNNLNMEQIKEHFLNRKLPETEDGKCFLQCLMVERGVINNGKFDVQKAKAINAERLSSKPDLKSKADTIADKCSKEVTPGSGRCDLGLELTKCTLKYAKEMGITEADLS